MEWTILVKALIKVQSRRTIGDGELTDVTCLKYWKSKISLILTTVLASFALFSQSKASTRPPQSVALRLERDLTYITCSIADSGPLNCLLDTGSAMTGVSPQVADRLRLRTHLDPTIPRVDVAAVALDSLVLHAGSVSWTAKRTSIAPVDLQLLDKEVSQEFHTDVVVGTELLERYQITIDPDVMEVRLSQPGTPLDPLANKIAASFISGVPFSLVGVKGADGHAVVAHFSLDTGSRPTLLLSQPFWSSRPPLATTLPKEPLSGKLTLSAIRIAGRTMRNIAAIEPDQASGLLASSRVGGVMGGPLLRHFIIVYDLPSQSIWMTPSKKAPPQ